MTPKDHDQEPEGISLPLPSSLDLRGKQSVRATFKLSERAINAISIVAVHLGIKQKSLFDHLIEDVQALNLIARNIGREKIERRNRIQKTYVLSRRTLNSLARIAEDFDTPRDTLVEFSIQRLLPIIARERQKHRIRKEILAEMDAHLRMVEQMLQKSQALLGDDDPVCEKLENAVKTCRRTYGSVADFVEKGKIIEEF